MPARSKMVGVWETGEGELVPPPRQPLPPWRYPHGPVPGDRWERAGYGFPPAPPQIRFPAGSTPDTAAHLISPRTDPAPRWGRGRSAEGAGGVGVPAEAYGYLSLPEARAGWGPPVEVYGYPLPQARAGRGLPAEGYGYSLPAKARVMEDAGQGAWVSPCKGEGRRELWILSRGREGADAIPRL